MKANSTAVAQALKILQQRGVSIHYESILNAAYTRLLKAGDCVIDIGAHSGFHTEHFLALVGPAGKVVAFEPQPNMVLTLKNRFATALNLQIAEVALSNTQGKIEFNQVLNALEESGIRQRHYNISDPIIKKIQVRVDTLDRYCADLKTVDYIKIDVEGAEIDCLRGAVSILQQHRPTISVEYGRPAYSVYDNDTMTLYNFASSIGYQMSDLFGNLITTESDWAAVCDLSYWDYFMVPTERAESWESLFP
jgi:FkbM family methyltransferase